MKKNLIRLTAIAILLFSATALTVAQESTTMATLYSQFKPAVITLTNGRTISNPLTNVFLKNSSLLYMNNAHTMEANMETISQVEFQDRKFVNVKGQLATIVDTIGSTVIYRIDYLDLEAYNANIKNNRQITSISMGVDQLGTTSVDISGEDDFKFPLVHKYYMLYNGELLLVHERDIWRRLPKDKRRLYKTIISLPDFSWVDDASIIKLVKAITD